VAIRLKAGMRLWSVTDTCQVVVIRAPGVAVDLRCGGQPFELSEREASLLSIARDFDGGSQIGKRYSDEALGLEVLCTKSGEGAISVGEALLSVKGAKSLPASD
jgi:hypothetical protein